MRASTDMVRHDRRYVVAMTRRRARWLERAGDPGLSSSQRLYARNRAETLTRGLRSRVRGCGERATQVACACGRKLAPWRCRRALVCWSCASHRRWQVVGRIEHAIMRQQAMLPAGRTLLLTLTAAHSVRRLGGRTLTRYEALEDLRQRLSEGWRVFTKRIGKEWGYTPYVGVWEVTPGNSGRGHLHMHVVVQWGWRDWSTVARMWRECCPSSTRISIVQSFDDQRTAAKRAAEYISKYLGKTRGRQKRRPNAGQWSPELHADVHAATYQMRWVFASRGHLPPPNCECPKCGQSAHPCDVGRVWIGSEAENYERDPILDTPEWFDAESWRQWPLIL